MSSRSATAPRRIPQQMRGQRRVAGLLEAAAGVMAETGYQATTMCAIAERAGSSIGSLYQFFPNKEAVAEELRGRYVKELEGLWATLAREAAALPVGELVSRLINLQIRFAEDHPAFLALLDAPPTRNTLRRRELIRTRIARVILIRKPDMPRSKAFRSAAVVQQIVRGLLALYARSERGEKSAVLEEFKAVLTGYLAPQW